MLEDAQAARREAIDARARLQTLQDQIEEAGGRLPERPSAAETEVAPLGDQVTPDSDSPDDAPNAGDGGGSDRPDPAVDGDDR